MIDPKDLKVGDKVVCRDHGNYDCLTIGETYPVLRVRAYEVIIRCGGTPSGNTEHHIIESKLGCFDKVESELPPKFKDLPRKEQLELVEAALDGRRLELYSELERRWKYDHLTAVVVHFQPDSRYRIADEKPVADETLPCPACGGESVFENHVGRRVRLYCAFDDCGVCGPFKDIIRDAIAAWNALSRNEWQPISTAPKDGTWFLWHSGSTICVIKWPEYEECFELSESSWMPLPAPPKEGERS